MRILVVDTAPAIRTRIVARLREGDHDVIAVAANTAEALAGARAFELDAIVLDVELPDAGALDAVIALRAAAPHARMVIVSNAILYRRLCLARGADAFLDKSFELDRLLATLMQETLNG